MELLINLINDLKTCLAIALGSSFILGYLYTKFRAKERYGEDINKYQDMINDYNIEANSIKSQNNDVIQKIETHKVNLEEQQSLSTNTYDTLQKSQKQKIESEKQIQTIKELHEKKSKILGDYNKEIVTLKGEFEIEDITKIDELKESLKSGINETDARFQSKSKDFDMLIKKQRDLENTNSDLNSKINLLKLTQNKKNLELAEASDTVSSLKSKLQCEFDGLLKIKEDNSHLIESYKNKLLDIKNSLS